MDEADLGSKINGDRLRGKTAYEGWRLSLHIEIMSAMSGESKPDPPFSALALVKSVNLPGT
jgi:hypothetical protein